MLRNSAAAIALAVLVAAAVAVSGARAADASFRSAGLAGPLHFAVYLPSGYATSGLRYPVVYFLHGLPAGTRSYENVGFVERALAQTDRQAILVVPQGARPGEPDPEWADHGPGHDWERAVAVELPRIVDARYRTIPTRSGRALIGVSAGGYGAMHLALAHLGAFDVVESWSGYFHPTDPTGTKRLSLGSAARDARADVHQELSARKTRLLATHAFIAFYVGRSDRRFVAENEQLHRELARAGVPHVFRLYAGGHTQQLWREHAAAWLAAALAHLAPAN